jgi:hypothetical protein
VATSRTVLINPVTPNRTAKSFPLGSVVPARSDGLGGWQEVTRERRESITDYTGPAVDKLDLTVRCDGLAANRSVEADVAWLVELGEKSGIQSPTFTASGPFWLSGTLFVLASMDWGTYYRRASDGHLVQQELTLHLWKYVAGDVVVTSPAKKHKAANGQSGTSHPKTYTVKSGDTLQSIAAKIYGTSKKWSDIASANNLRDPNRLKPGQVLKLPS